MKARLQEEVSQIAENDPETMWQDFQNRITNVEKEILGEKTMGRGKKKKTAWWVPELQEAVRNKQKAFRLWMKERTPERRRDYVTERDAVNRLRRKAQENMWERIGNDLAEDHTGNKKLLYTMAKRYRGKGGEQVKTIKDPNGASLSDPRAINKRWNEYFADLLNVNNVNEELEQNQTTITATTATEDTTQEITLEELKNALKSIKNNKSPGPDEIPIEVIKSAGHEMIEFLVKLLNTCYTTGTVPKDWNKSQICPIFKNKGDPHDCKNYRGISLMSHTGKLYERILERRLRNFVEHTLMEEQCGFRPGRGTVDQISGLKLLLEKSWEFANEQHICFLDLEKAFDRVPRQKMWSVIKQSGVPHKLLRAIMSTYNDQTSSVIGSTEHFSVTTGVRQGSVLSPLLFITYLDVVMREVNVQQPARSECFAYADDIAQTATSKKELEDIMRCWDNTFKEHGLKMSVSKTEYMMISRDPIKEDLHARQ